MMARQTRIYQPGPYVSGQTIELLPGASQHVGKVLRLHVNDHITLFQGDNREFLAVISAINKKKVTVCIQEELVADRESFRPLHLAQAVSKGEKMDWVIQKAVELGVHSITPLLTDHTVIKLDNDRWEKKLTHWQGIVIAASEQSGRNILCKMNPLCTYVDFVAKCQAPFKFILDPACKTSWQDMPFETGEIVLLVGPEGGLSSHEITLAHHASFHSVRLGPRVLRTETAAIAGLSILQALAGDF